jgi:hypothetical protein
LGMCMLQDTKTTFRCFQDVCFIRRGIPLICQEKEADKPVEQPVSAAKARAEESV